MLLFIPRSLCALKRVAAKVEHESPLFKPAG
jgi:hypothetical protein